MYPRTWLCVALIAAMGVGLDGQEFKAESATLLERVLRSAGVSETQVALISPLIEPLVAESLLYQAVDASGKAALAETLDAAARAVKADPTDANLQAFGAAYAAAAELDRYRNFLSAAQTLISTENIGDLLRRPGPPTENPEGEDVASSAGRPEESTILGMAVTGLSRSKVADLGLYVGTRGVLIVRVEEGSAAAAAGIQAGMVLESIGHRLINDVASFQARAERLHTGDQPLMCFWRRRKGNWERWYRILALYRSAGSKGPAARAPSWAKAQTGSKIDPVSKLPFSVTDRKTGIEMVLIPAGEFFMGASPGDGLAYGFEKPRHRVRITKPFYLGKYEVTQGEWRRVMRGNPSHFKKGDRYPVEQVSWNTIQVFLKRTGLRLPTEAEWEYACRAGTTGPRYGALPAIAWYSDNSGATTHPVGGKAANLFGLHDMLGNVWEWCSDGYDKKAYARERAIAVDPHGLSTGNRRVLRGGSWYGNGGQCRASDRDHFDPAGAADIYGFRVARTP